MFYINEGNRNGYRGMELYICIMAKNEGNKNDVTANVEEKHDALLEAFDSVVVTLSTLKAQLSAAQQQVRAVQKMAMKERRITEKLLQKKKQRADRAPSGFAKPSAISDELRSFMGAEPGAEFARTAVTQFIIKYISEHNLQNPSNRKEIRPDKKLQGLLQVGNGEQLTYFNLQKYMNKHFPGSKSNKQKN